MELQELSLLSIYGQLRYQLRPRFPDVRGAFIEELTAVLDLPHWGWGDEALTLWDEERTLSLLAGGREARAQFSRVEDTEKAVEMATTHFSMTLSRFGVQEVEFVGARTFWAAPVDSFDELRDSMLGRLGSDSFADTLKAVGRPVSDVGWVVEFHGENPQHSLRVGPMTREQAVAQHIPDAKLEDLPENFLFVDLDRFYSGTKYPASEGPDRWEKTFRKNLEIADSLGRIVTGTGSVR
jgi:hypothetical protein